MTRKDKEIALLTHAVIEMSQRLENLAGNIERKLGAPRCRWLFACIPHVRGAWQTYMTKQYAKSASAWMTRDVS